MKHQVTRTQTAVLAAAVMIVAGAIAVAQTTQPAERTQRGPQDGQRAERGHRRGPGGGMMRAMRDLDLSDDQQDQVRTIMQEQRTAHKAAMEEHRDEIEEIDRQIKELVEKKRSLLGGGPEDFMEKVKAVLTDEQKTQLEESMAQMRERGPRRGGPEGQGFRDGGDGERPQRRGRMNRNRKGDDGGSNEMPEF